MEVDYSTLRDLLKEGKWREAEDETRELLIQAAGKAAVKRGWVYFSEIKFIPGGRGVDGRASGVWVVWMAGWLAGQAGRRMAGWVSKCGASQHAAGHGISTNLHVCPLALLPPTHVLRLRLP